MQLARATLRLPSGIHLLVLDESHGRLDTEAWNQWCEALLKEGSLGLVIDCSGLVMPSSPLMSALVWCRNRFRQHHSDMVVTGIGGRLRSALMVTELITLLAVADDRQQAEERVRQTAV